ncbi:hypothetical protein ACN2CC_04840 [Mesorhizobium muleiense]|uniref:hypothetical protein n=1 Tax=Mesorhizobium muleiense TaxID=1004279 RepID=UPI003AFA01FC
MVTNLSIGTELAHRSAESEASAKSVADICRKSPTFCGRVLRQEFVEEFNADDFVAKLRTVTSGAVCRAAMKHRQAAVADSRLIRYSVLPGSTSFNPASQA